METYTAHFPGGEIVTFESWSSILRKALDNGSRFLTDLDANLGVSRTINLHNVLYITKENK